MGHICTKPPRSPPPPKQKPVSPSKVPKLARRRSAPRPRASKQDIEVFYREGRELLRAEQERIEGERLRELVRQPTDTDEGYDEDAVLLQGTVLGAKKSKLLARPGTMMPATEINTAASTSSNEYDETGRRRFSFEGGAKTAYVQSPADSFSGNDSPTGPTGLNERHKFSTNLSNTVSGSQRTSAARPDMENPEMTESSLNSSWLNLSSLMASTPHSAKSNEDQPPTPSIKPYNMPSITSTIETISEAFSRPLEPSNSQAEFEQSALSLDSVKLQRSRSGEKLGSAEQNHSEEFLTRPRPPFHARKQKSENSLELATSSDPSQQTRERQQSVDSGTSSEYQYGPEEIFSHIRTLVKPSTSTFMSGASSSQVQLQRQYSPISEGGTIVHHQSSHGSFKQGEGEAVHRKSSLGTMIFPPSTPPQKRINMRDSVSSFYPSGDISRCQSLESSMVDLPIPSASVYGGLVADPYSTLSPIISPRLSLEQTENFIDVTSPGFSTFRFPWNITPISGNEGSPGLESNASFETAVVLQNDKKHGRSSSLPVRRHSDLSRTPKRFLAASTLNTVVSRTASPESRADGTDAASTVTPRRYHYSKHSMMDGKHRLTSRSSWYSKASETARGLRNSVSVSAFGPKKRNSPAAFPGAGNLKRSKSPAMPAVKTGLGISADLAGISNDPSRSSAANTSMRSKSLTLRKGITRSMARIRSKLSLSGTFRTTSSPITRISTPSKGVRTGTPRDRQSSSTNMDEIEFPPSLPAEMLRKLSSGEEGTSEMSSSSPRVRLAASGLHRSHTTRSMPLTGRSAGGPLGRRSTSASRVGMRRRDTAYDDCVLFPFHDGEDAEQVEVRETSETWHTPLSRPRSRHELDLRRLDQRLRTTAVWQEHVMEARTVN